MKVARQLAFAGWTFGDDEDVTSDDEYTPPELVELIEDFLGGTIDLDTCWDKRCHVHPRVGYTKTDDGLRHSWVFDTRSGSPDGRRFRNRWIQPPYSRPRRWIEQLVNLHAAEPPEVVGDSLALIKADTSTQAWRAAWKADAILFFARRIAHTKPGRILRAPAKFPQAMLYFGRHADGFAEWFGDLGHVVRKSTAQRSAERDERESADAITAVDEPVIDMSPLAENPQAWPAVPTSTGCTCPALPCPQHGRNAFAKCMRCGAEFGSVLDLNTHMCGGRS